MAKRLGWTLLLLHMAWSSASEGGARVNIEPGGSVNIAAGGVLNIGSVGGAGSTPVPGPMPLPPPPSPTPPPPLPPYAFYTDAGTSCAASPGLAVIDSKTVCQAACRAVTGEASLTVSEMDLSFYPGGCYINPKGATNQAMVAGGCYFNVHPSPTHLNAKCDPHYRKCVCQRMPS